MSRRQFLRAGCAAGIAASLPSVSAQSSETETAKVFRWAINFAETGFDPAQISDLASNYVVSNIFESPLQYDHLARPALIKPRTAAAMPEISSDFKTVTVRIRPGIFSRTIPHSKANAAS